ncbi:hypothetical protein [Desulfoplanes formicivorans]|uniref:Uncharacterized protein n=1 Tax=Desulfoplanes formicivorans TaxID=1592317 RepID=A0A194AHR1_9BACT|nr:hypothetical protein [Desulfoplanes formicivorans]GAU08616.1 hypothetical protein DPF_1330 [Desulfoplanes formicivorans]
MQLSFLIFLGSLFVGYLGRNCRFGFWGNFFASMLLTPPVGFLLVLAAQPKKDAASSQKDRDHLSCSEHS